MSEARALKVELVERAVPLAPCAVWAEGAAARALVAKLGARGAEGLEGVGARDFVVLLGDEDALPWVDGARYLGRDPSAPALLLPTRRATSWPVELVVRALARAHGEGPLALLDATRVVPLAGARPVSLEVLARVVGA